MRNIAKICITIAAICMCVLLVPQHTMAAVKNVEYQKDGSRIERDYEGTKLTEMRTYRADGVILRKVHYYANGSHSTFIRNNETEALVQVYEVDNPDMINGFVNGEGYFLPQVWEEEQEKELQRERELVAAKEESPKKEPPAPFDCSALHVEWYNEIARLGYYGTPVIEYCTAQGLTIDGQNNVICPHCQNEVVQLQP